VNVTDAFSFNV
jgi:hypothetical protein